LGGKCLAHTALLPFSQHFEQCSFPHFLDDTQFFQMVARFYTAEQCSAINNLNMIASSLQLSKSVICNLKLCVTSAGMHKVLQSYLSAFATNYAVQGDSFAMIALLQTSQKVFLESAG